MNTEIKVFILFLSHQSRTQLELELKQEKERKSQHRGGPGKRAQKPEPHMVTCVLCLLAYSTYTL